MNGKRLIEEFKEMVLSSDENSFILDDGNGAKILCVKVSVGKAIFVYVCREYMGIQSDKKLVTDILEQMKLIAVVKSGIIYLTDRFTLCCYGNSEVLPDNVIDLGEYMKEVNLHTKYYIIEKYYAKLPYTTLSEEDIERCKVEAKNILTSGQDLDEYIDARLDKNIKKFKEQDFVDFLCGVIDLESEARKNFEENSDMWMELKASLKVIQRIVEEDPEEVFDPEGLKIIDSLNGIEAKNVQVEFSFNGKTAKGKVDPKSILRMIESNDYFSDFNFDTMANGKKIINDLGAARYRGEKEKEVLTCKHISKITYGRKVLYQK